MKKSIRKACAVTMLGTLLVGSIPMYQGLAASKKLKVNNKSFTITVGKTKTLTTNMTATFKSSNKKVVSLKNVGKKKCTLVAKKQGKCTIYVKAKKQKTIKVTVTVNKKKVTPKATVKPKVTVKPNTSVSPKETAVVTVTPENTTEPAMDVVTASPLVEVATGTATPIPTDTAMPEATASTLVTSVPVTEKSAETAAPQKTEAVIATPQKAVTEQPLVTLTPEKSATAESAKPEIIPTVAPTPQKTEKVTATLQGVVTAQPTKTLTPEELEQLASAAPVPMPTIKETEVPQVTESVKPLVTPVATQSAILPEDADTMGGKVNNLGYHLSKLLAQTEEEDGNRVISSYSILMALTMLDNGAAGETKADLEKVLGITDLEAWNQEFGKHFKTKCNDTIQDHDTKQSEDDDIIYFKEKRFAPELSAANSFWYNNTSFSFDSKEQKDFMSKLLEDYQAESKPLDFSNPDRNPKDDINQWVEDKTAKKIKNLLSENLNPNKTCAVLVNTLYFNGCWQNTFEKELTKKKPFYGKDGTTTVDMMNSPREYYSYYEKGDIMGIELPFYDGHGIVMDIITTKDQENKDAIAIYEKMSNTEKNQFYQSLGDAEHKLVNLQLPKFKLEYGTVDLTEQLKKMGMQKAFDRVLAEFPSIRGKNIENVFVDKVMHKAVIEVNEMGATAAAATAVIMNAEACPGEIKDPLSFNVNRPFVFAIRDKKTNMIYFMGQIENLKNK